MLREMDRPLSVPQVVLCLAVQVDELPVEPQVNPLALPRRGVAMRGWAAFAEFGPRRWCLPHDSPRSHHRAPLALDALAGFPLDVSDQGLDTAPPPLAQVPGPSATHSTTI